MKVLAWIVLITTMLATTSCQSDENTTAEIDSVPEIAQDYGVIAEGQLLPYQHVDLSFSMAGKVTEILQSESSFVRKGQIIARLDNKDSLNASYAQAEANAKQALNAVRAAELDLEQSNNNVQQSENTLAQVQLEQPQLTLESTRARLDVISAQQSLDSLQDTATLLPAQIENEIQIALTRIETAQDSLPAIDKPDVQYYSQQVELAQNALEQLRLNSTILDIGTLTDAVDSTADLVEDEKEFLDKVKKAIDGCQVNVDGDDYTKLTFSQDLTYRNTLYKSGTVYDVDNWIADELLDDYPTIVSKATLTCDTNRKVTVDSRKTTLEDAQERYNDVVSQYDEAVEQLGKSRLQNKKLISSAESDLAKAQRNLEWAQSGIYSREGIIAAANQSADDPAVPQSVSLATQQLEADIKLAKAQLSDARNRLSDLENGIDPDALELSKARLDQALAYVNYTDTQIQQIQLRISQATISVELAKVGEKSALLSLNTARTQMRASQAALDSATQNLAHNELVAPWDGTIADLPLTLDEYVQPGQPIATLADFSVWKVETDNLTEIEVPDVSVGQNVIINPDALPELKLNGKVSSISQLFTEKRGDVTYTVTIDLEESDPRLRWGMTMVVTFSDS
ncbi:MAG: HlyD family efflux transporter periplasmic adaptor subunit [Anaerolineales bacterium]